jgi:hypothetical protein
VWDRTPGLIWTSGSFITTLSEAGPPERWRLVRLDITHPSADPVAITPWSIRLWSGFWADRSGEWVVWDEYDDAGEPQDFVVLHEGERTVMRPPGYGGRR